jgi:hypothetical protein
VAGGRTAVRDSESTDRRTSDPYEPPAIVTLGDVEEFTAGDHGGSPTLDGA